VFCGNNRYFHALYKSDNIHFKPYAQFYLTFLFSELNLTNNYFNERLFWGLFRRIKYFKFFETIDWVLKIRFINNRKSVISFIILFKFFFLLLVLITLFEFKFNQNNVFSNLDKSHFRDFDFKTIRSKACYLVFYILVFRSNFENYFILIN